MVAVCLTHDTEGEVRVGALELEKQLRVGAPCPCTRAEPEEFVSDGLRAGRNVREATCRTPTHGVDRCHSFSECNPGWASRGAGPKGETDARYRSGGIIV